MSGSSHLAHVTVVCRKCRKRLRAPASAAGKRGQCGQCGEIFVIPAQTGKAMPPAAAAPLKTSPDGNEMVTVPVDVVLKSGFISGGIVVALAVLVAVGVISYMVFCH